MEELWAWVTKNSDLLFSGIGVAVIGWVMRLIFRKSNASSTQSIRSGNGSINVQGGRDVIVGTKNVKNDVEQH